MRGRPSWYLIGKVSGRTIFDGPFATENQALSKGEAIDDWDNNDWAVKLYMTSNLAVAKSTWKSQQAESTGSMAQSLIPIRGIKTDRKP